MDLWIILFFLGLSLILYVLLGGADFGSGLVELSAPKKLQAELRSITYRAIGPVWEANHIWIILAVVILFVAFPKAYAIISTSLHIPLSLLLLGIIIRGCAFTFRHYDAIEDHSQVLYNRLFQWSSMLTPFALGVCAASLFYGRIDNENLDFYLRFIAPWCNFFCFSVGLFFTAICAMLASSFLVGEASEEHHKKFFAQRAKFFSALTVLLGAIILTSGLILEVPAIKLFFVSRVSIICMIFATIFLLSLWRNLSNYSVLFIRVFAGATISSVLVAWFVLQYPVMIFQVKESQTVFSLAAGASTLSSLRFSLLFGTCLIVPGLIFLIWTFKRSTINNR